jgi:hypothetical protein
MALTAVRFAEPKALSNISKHSHNALPVQVQHGCCNVMAECHCHCWVQLAAVRLVRQHAPVQLVTQSTLYRGSSSNSSDNQTFAISTTCIVC